MATTISNESEKNGMSAADGEVGPSPSKIAKLTELAHAAANCGSLGDAADQDPLTNGACKNGHSDSLANGKKDADDSINKYLIDTAVLRFKKLSENATAPTRGSTGAVGSDLYSAYDVTLPARGRDIVKTDIAVAMPPGTYGRVASRSGLALKHGLDVGAGVIDADYRGNVCVMLFNHSDVDYHVTKGDRVAQLICERACIPVLAEVTDLDDTERGSGGYGSTGK